METKADYITATDTDPPPSKRCHCGAVLGRLVNVKGRAWLDLGTVVLRNGHGRCKKCNSWVSYDDLDMFWSDHMKQRREALAKSE